MRVASSAEFVTTIPGVAVRAQIFRGVKAEACGVAERTGPPAFVGRADRLSVVLDYRSLRDFANAKMGSMSAARP